jgi:aspartyl protease family protein
MNQLILAGVVAGIAVSIPILYQSNPRAFDTVLHSGLTEPPAGAASDAPATLATVRAEEPAPLGRKVRLIADARGHFAADFRLNGHDVPALIDTGATVVAINASTARRIGIVLTPSDFTHSVVTANGATKAAAAMIDTMRIGRIYIDKVPAVVLEDSALAGTLVGMSFLKRLSKYEVENGAMILQQ